jgi:hypothetical protein
MGLEFETTGSFEFEPGTYEGHLIKMEKRFKKFMDADTGETEDRSFLIWYFAIDEEGYEDVTLTAISSCSFGPKSKPRSWANAILRRKLGDHEKFNEDDLKNKPVMLSIENEDTDRGTFARITGLSPVRGRDRTKAEAEDNAA